jgi:hypothetical protein
MAPPGEARGGHRGRLKLIAFFASTEYFPAVLRCGVGSSDRLS